MSVEILEQTDAAKVLDVSPGAFTEKNIVPSFRYRRTPAFPRGECTMTDRPQSDPPTDSLYEGDEGEGAA